MSWSYCSYTLQMTSLLNSKVASSLDTRFSTSSSSPAIQVNFSIGERGTAYMLLLLNQPMSSSIFADSWFGISHSFALLCSSTWAFSQVRWQWLNPSLTLQARFVAVQLKHTNNLNIEDLRGNCVITHCLYNITNVINWWWLLQLWASTGTFARHTPWLRNFSTDSYILPADSQHAPPTVLPSPYQSDLQPSHPVFFSPPWHVYGLHCC